MTRRIVPVALLSLALAAVSAAQRPSDAPDLDMYRRVRDEGTVRSRVMDFATELVDGVGPRLTGSPNLKRATTWSLDRLRQMGFSNVRTESWGEFGMGWHQRSISLRMTKPDFATFIAHAGPWSPPTRGIVTGEVVAIRGFTDEAQFEAFRGRLAGKIVLMGRAPGIPDVTPIETPLFERLNDRQLAEWARSEPSPDTENWDGFARAEELAEKADRFLASQGALAAIVPSGNNRSGGISGGTIWDDSNATLGHFVYLKAHAAQLPIVIVTNEHYGRMKRLLDRNVPVTLELSVDTAFTGDREEGLNVFADITGVDAQRKDELVMLGGHLDSWASGTGATDDGAGVVICMEAMRILQTLQLRPRRTIRLALWTGEEQGMLGSLDYVKRHLADFPRAGTAAEMIPEMLRRRTGPVVTKPDHARLSALYNVDFGSGKIRGIGMAGNVALTPIFQQWIAPLQDLGLAVVAPRRGCGGDCSPFVNVGIPTPAFHQDPLDYDTRTHHTNMDTFEHLIPEDLRQAAIVVATMVYNTAMREQLLPRLSIAD